MTTPLAMTATAPEEDLTTTSPLTFWRTTRGRSRCCISIVWLVIIGVIIFGALFYPRICTEKEGREKIRPKDDVDVSQECKKSQIAFLAIVSLAALLNVVATVRECKTSRHENR